MSWIIKRKGEETFVANRNLTQGKFYTSSIEDAFSYNRKEFAETGRQKLFNPDQFEVIDRIKYKKSKDV